MNPESRTTATEAEVKEVEEVPSFLETNASTTTASDDSVGVSGIAADCSAPATVEKTAVVVPPHYTLFVGDLSIFCAEEDLLSAFSEYGEVLDAKIIRCEETKKNLSYGFVKYLSREAAAAAIESLNGTLLCGRPLRIGLATRRHRHEFEAPPAAPQRNHGERSSVHVSYSSEQTNDTITEEDLRRVFSRFGHVVDVTVKKFEIHEKGQRGYGFVHFSYNEEGMNAALRASEELSHARIDQVVYKCSISHRLRQCLNAANASLNMYSSRLPTRSQSFNSMDELGNGNWGMAMSYETNVYNNNTTRGPTPPGAPHLSGMMYPTWSSDSAQTAQMPYIQLCRSNSCDVSVTGQAPDGLSSADCLRPQQQIYTQPSYFLPLGLSSCSSDFNNAQDIAENQRQQQRYSYHNSPAFCALMPNQRQMSLSMPPLPPAASSAPVTAREEFVWEGGGSERASEGTVAYDSGPPLHGVSPPNVMPQISDAESVPSDISNQTEDFVTEEDVKMIDSSGCTAADQQTSIATSMETPSSSTGTATSGDKLPPMTSAYSNHRTHDETHQMQLNGPPPLQVPTAIGPRPGQETSVVNPTIGVPWINYVQPNSMNMPINNMISYATQEYWNCARQQMQGQQQCQGYVPQLLLPNNAVPSYATMGRIGLLTPQQQQQQQQMMMMMQPQQVAPMPYQQYQFPMQQHSGVAYQAQLQPATRRRSHPSYPDRHHGQQQGML